MAARTADLASHPTDLPDLGYVSRVQRTLVDWYQTSGRDLPWRHTRDPYAILVSEMMLQQTQVERVLPKWRAWLAQFPTLRDLADASRGEVIRAWQGLGYNLRAVRLHEIARQAVERFGGQLPGSVPELLSLKGIGHYTAGAVACFAFEQPVAMVDTNVRRVLGRVLLGEPLLGPEREREARALADAALPIDDAYAWNQGLMDLGATICTAARPACLVCPLLAECRAAPAMSAWPAERQRLVRESRAAYASNGSAAGQDAKAASQRYYRGRVVDALRGLDAGESLDLAVLGPCVKTDFGADDVPWLEGLVRKLARDELVVVDGRADSLRVRLPH